MAALLGALQDGPQRAPAGEDDPSGRVVIGGLALTSTAALVLGIRDRKQAVQG